VLRTRVLTAIVLLIGFLASLFFLPWTIFAILVAVFFAVGAWEWANLAGVGSHFYRLTYMFFLVGFAGLLGWVTEWTDNEELFKAILIAACSWWALCLLWIQGYPTSVLVWGSRPVRLMMGMFVLVPAWLSCLYLRQQSYGTWLVFMLVLVVAAADIGAYFTGRAFGKCKLAVRVSPGKSWEGVWGGAVFALFVGSGYSLLMGQSDWLMALIIIAPAALVSVVGDLLESMVKRHRGVKDSSQLLPGHGGVLDRIDGLVAAAPVFALAVLATHWQL
jgi:phosphatidate cytidylyltransferase